MLLFVRLDLAKMDRQCWRFTLLSLPGIALLIGKNNNQNWIECAVLAVFTLESDWIWITLDSIYPNILLLFLSPL